MKLGHNKPKQRYPSITLQQQTTSPSPHPTFLHKPPSSSSSSSPLKPSALFRGVDHIVWINLDRSVDRRNHMVNHVLGGGVSHTRIAAVDGRNGVGGWGGMSPFVVACSLSHIQAIHALNDVPGEVFLVLEDDVVLDMPGSVGDMNSLVTHLREQDPQWNILQVHTIHSRNSPKSKSTQSVLPWCTQFESSAAYLLSRKGVQTFCQRYPLGTMPTSPADIFVFSSLPRGVYSSKYNMVSTLDKDSLIHPQHVTLIHRPNNEHEKNRILHEDFFTPQSSLLVSFLLQRNGPSPITGFLQRNGPSPITGFLQKNGPSPIMGLKKNLRKKPHFSIQPIG